MSHALALARSLAQSSIICAGMLVRVVLPNKEEGLFNTDCSVALLLDTIKKRHQLPRDDCCIDLCSVDGILKNLTSHVYDSSSNALFELREQCIVVRVTSTVTAEGGDSRPTYMPVLDEYSQDKDFMAALNEDHQSTDKKKAHTKHSAHRGNKSPTPETGRHKNTRTKNRRHSIVK